MSDTDSTVRRDETRDRSRMRRYLVSAAMWYAVLLVLPSEVQGPWYLLFGFATLVVAWRRVRRLPTSVRTPTTMIVLAGLASLVGAGARGVHEILAGTDDLFPSPADAFSLLSYLLLLVAIAGIIRQRVPRLQVDPVLDAVVGGIAAALLQWSLVLLPYLASSGNDTAAVAANLVFSVLSLMLVVAAVLALVAGSRPSPSNRLLAIGLVATFAVDIVATLITSGRVAPVTMLYLSPIVLIFSAAGLLHPSVTYITTPPSDAALSRRLSRRRITVLASALLCPPVLMLWATLEAGANTWLMLPAGASLALTPLVVTRLGRLVHQNEELAALEAALRNVGERLVSAETEEDIARVVTVGAEQILGEDLRESGLVLEPLDDDTQLRAAGIATAVDELRVRIATIEHPTTADMVELPSHRGGDQHVAYLVVVHRSIKAALVLVTSNTLAEARRNAVETLCREAAIALRAVEQTELQVRARSEARFGALVDNSSDIVAVLNRDLQPEYVSPVAARLLGYPDGAMGEANMLALVHPADEEVARQLLGDVRFGLQDTAELRLRRHDGTYVWFEVGGADLTSNPDIAGIVLNLREIDDRKRAEEQLVHSEARFKALVQNSADLLLVVDEDCVIRYASPSVEQVVGESHEAVLGRPVELLFGDSNVDWPHRLPALCRKDHPRSELFEFHFVDTAGLQHTIETSVTDLRSEPSVGGFVLNARDVTERTRMEKQLEYQATHDELTGLGNRVRVLSDLNEILARNSGSTTVAAILVGLDDFKDINDSLGHASGDQLLVAVSERVTSLLGFGDVAARVGGDTFAVVVERARGETQISELAENLLAAIATPFEIDGRELSVTASAGIEFDHDRSRTSEILLRNADIAMFRAKHEGKRRVVVFEPHMHTASFDRLELRADLARAVAAGQLVAHYQPVVEIATGRFIGAEALIRWEHPERGLLGPGLFIPLAEETGLIGPIGQWILDRACADLAQWRRQFGESVDDLTISVNLAVEQLVDESIVSSVRDILARHGLPASKLVLEVTESTLITDTETIRATMQKLRALGARLAIDDFGTGYSSLGYIQQFDFDILKIDKSFVDALDSFTNQRIVTAVIELAQQLGVRTIAEGIETQLQADLLGDLHCVFGQGYLYSRPVPERELSELLLRRADDHARSR